MAGLADAMYETAVKTAQTGGSGLAEAINNGAGLAMRQEANQRAIEQNQRAREELQMTKIDKVLGWYDTGAKMSPEMQGPFLKNWVPNGINAIGLSDAFHPDTTKMLQADPAFGAFIRHKITDMKDGGQDPSIYFKAMRDPAEAAKLSADPEYAAFKASFGPGGMQEALQASIGAIRTAGEKRSDQNFKMAETEAQARIANIKQQNMFNHQDTTVGNKLGNDLSDKQRTEMAPVIKQQSEVANVLGARDRSLAALAKNPNGSTVSPQDMGTMLFSMLHGELGRVNETEINKMLGINGAAGRTEDAWVKYFQGGANPQVIKNLAIKADAWSKSIDALGDAKVKSFESQRNNSTELSQSKKSSLRQEMDGLYRPAFYKSNPPPNGVQSWTQNGHDYIWNPRTGKYE